MIIYSILLAFVFFMFGFLVSAIFSSEKIKTLEEWAERERRLRLALLDETIKNCINILKNTSRNREESSPARRTR